MRFDREWGALRSLRGRVAACASSATCRSTSRTAAPTTWRTRSSSSRGAVAGVPPDLFARDGQLWGNPLYDWPAMRADGYRWWIERFRRSFEHVDLMRVDHFRGFVAYWAVPTRQPDGPSRAVAARTGRCTVSTPCGPSSGALDLVAEDLGVITPPVVRLRHELGLPGMVVLQFALGGGPRNPHRPENHPEQAVVYTGTHDNDTALGWWESLSEQRARRLRPRPGRPGLVADRARRGAPAPRSRSRRCRTCSRSAARPA